MKMNRWIGLLLALVMVLGLFPATALAEGTDSNLPNGYQQMYVKKGENYETVAELEAGIGTDILFYIKNGDEYTALNSTVKPDGSSAYAYVNNITVTCSDSKLGETGVGPNGTNWRAGDAIPGTFGYLYAEHTVDGETTKYAISASISAPLVGVYSDSELSNYLISSARSFEPL